MARSCSLPGRRQDELDKAVEEIGKNVVAVKSDVFKLEDIDRLYKNVAQKKGKIDILFANAGTVDTSAATPEHFDWRMMSCGVRQIRQ